MHFDFLISLAHHALTLPGSNSAVMTLALRRAGEFGSGYYLGFMFLFLLVILICFFCMPICDERGNISNAKENWKQEQTEG